MKVPFVNYPLQYKNIKKELNFNINRILSRGDLVYRDDIQKFEKDIASYVGDKFGIGTDSCTGAMFISLKGAGIGPGDEVITVSHTYVATIDVIVHCGATPVLVDVRDDFNINPDLIEKAITSKTKAIMPVHLNGRACEMDKIMAIAKKHNLIVIEDTAQSLGAKYDGKMAGSFGLTGCFSFYPAKILGSYGESGMAVTNDENLADKLYLLRDHGERPGYRKTDKSLKLIELYGFNTILDNMQATVLNVKFKYFPKWVLRRRKIAEIYHKGLDGVGDVILPPAPEQGRYFDVYQNYVIRTKRRDELIDYLDKKGVETLVSWRIPNHKQERLTNLNKFNLPKTEQISKEVISLPMYPELTDGQVKYVVDCIKKFYGHSAKK